MKETDIVVDDSPQLSEKAAHVDIQPQIPSVRKPRASLSGFSHALADIRAFPKKIASGRRKSPVLTSSSTLNDSNHSYNDITFDGDNLMKEHSVCYGVDLHPPSRAPNWLLRCVSTSLRNRRQTSNTASCPPTAKWIPQDSPSSPAPVAGFAPPTFPDDHTSGAAARAAAAEQNEMIRCLRRLCSKERGIRRDSESGIGIETQSLKRETAIVRLDPYHILPRELFTHVLAFLDAQSLVSSELVSRAWYSVASDDLVWKSIFLHDFRPHSHTTSDYQSNFQIRGQGLGNIAAEQDWKSMWRTRKALDQRWMDNHAAAIYLEGHYDSVYCVQFDEDKIVTGSRDRTVRVWDARTYKCIKILGVPSRNHPITLPRMTGADGPRPFTVIFSQQFKLEPYAGKPNIHHTGSILCLQYDDELMVTGSSDFTCIMWDIKVNWKPIRRVRYHTAGVLDVCFDQKHVVSCSKDTTVCLWDRDNGELIHRLTGHRGPVNAVQLRGNLAVSASGDGIAKLWNLIPGHCIKEFPSKDRGMACVEFSPDSLTIFAGGNDQVIYQFDASTGELIREMTGHHGLVRSLHLDSANGRLVSGSYDNTVRAYDIRTGQPIVHLTKWTASWILSAKLDYRRIVATSQDSRIVIIDFGFDLPGTDRLEHRPQPTPGSMTSGTRRLKI
ncbi:MAG: hypothetical protein Q9216_003413 [Gyalolechia sp. 2 TL-2023]